MGGESALYFQSDFTGIWVILQPGDICILMWFGHISCPQVYSFLFHCSEIPPNFLSFTGRKSPSSTGLSQGFLHTKSIIFEMENKPSVGKNKPPFLPVSSDLVSLQLNSHIFQAGMFNISWRDAAAWTPIVDQKTHTNCRNLVGPEPGEDAPAVFPGLWSTAWCLAQRSRLPCPALHQLARTAALWFICPVIISTHYNHLEQHYRPHYGLGTCCH